MLYALKLTP